MKQPITVTVSRELGNAGDVITKFTDADGKEHKLAVPGDCSPYHALATMKPFLEAFANGIEPTPKEGVPFCVVDPETKDVSIVLDGVEMNRVETVFERRAKIAEEAALKDLRRAVEGEEPPATEPEKAAS